MSFFILPSAILVHKLLEQIANNYETLFGASENLTEEFSLVNSIDFSKFVVFLTHRPIRIARRILLFTSYY